VDDLFFNLPARRKFLKTATAELKRIIQIVQDYALVYPKIRFRLSNDGKNILDIGDAGSTDEVLQSLWGEEHRSVSARAERERASVAMWWNALPGSRRVNVTAFVNGRRVQDPTIRAALNSADGAIFGEWVVMLTLPPEDVDVNIHPAKAEVRFRRTGPIFELVSRCARNALLEGGGFSKDDIGASGSPGLLPNDALRTIDPWENYVPPAGRFEVNAPFASEPGGTARAASPERVLFPASELGSPRIYLGQAQGGYLVFDDPRGLCLVDAHAAHERILYEQIEDAYSGRKNPSQSLISPQELPSAVLAGVMLYRSELSKMGFRFSLPTDDGADTEEAVMTAVPVLRGLGRLSSLEMLRSAIRGIEEETDPSKRDREVWWRWARTACRDAIKLGASVERAEALDLFERLERCRTPYSCPHGRPTTIFLAGEKLRSWFER
jgi:DNA mismatch repair protein MutL